jgi:hypothetical protein
MLLAAGAGAGEGISSAATPIVARILRLDAHDASHVEWRVSLLRTAARFGCSIAPLGQAARDAQALAALGGYVVPRWWTLQQAAQGSQQEKRQAATARGRDLVAALVRDAAWAKRGPIVCLRRRLRQAWEAEMDARDEAEAAAAAADASAAAAAISGGVIAGEKA